jgi:hypothetical protein
MKPLNVLVDELIMLQEVSEIPEIAEQIEERKQEIVDNFSKEECDAAFSRLNESKTEKPV